MKRINTFALMFLAFVFWSERPAYAFFTFDFAGTGGNIVKFVSSATKDGGEAMKEVKNTRYGKTMGDGSEFGEYKKSQSSFDKISSAVSKVKDSEEYQKAKKAKEANDKISAKNKEIEALQAQKSGLEAAANLTYDSEASKIEGQIKTLKENSDLLRIKAAQDADDTGIYQAAIEDNNNRIGLLEKQLQEAAAVREQSINGGAAPLDKKIFELQADIAKISAKLAGDFGALKESKSSADALQKSVDKMYLPKGAVENPETMEPIRQARMAERRQSLLDTYEGLAQLKLAIAEVAEKAQDTMESSTMMDTSDGSIGANTDIKVRTVEELFQYAQLLVLDLKMQTAVDYASNPDFAIKEVKTVTDLRNYIFKSCDAVEGEKK